MALHLSVLVKVAVAAVLRSPKTLTASHNRSLFCVHIKSSGGGLTESTIFNMWAPRLCSEFERGQRNTLCFLWASPRGDTACSVLVLLADTQHGGCIPTVSCGGSGGGCDGQLPVSATPSYFLTCTSISIITLKLFMHWLDLSIGLKWAKSTLSCFDTIIIVVISTNNGGEVADRNQHELLCSVQPRAHFARQFPLNL